jgi:uncharacterized protein YecE (DUF72 family)
MQDDLFGQSPPPPHAASASATRPRARGVQAAELAPALHTLAAHMPPLLRMGVSTWSYPGWEGLVWQGSYSESVLSQKGLTALSQHPLMRTVCIDRTFWRPLSTEQYARYAAQVPEDFRFMVKCPNAVTDALIRAEDGKGQQRNPVFLNPQLAVDQFVQPCLQGLGAKLGVLVLQISPLPWDKFTALHVFFAQLDVLLTAMRQALPADSRALIAVEVRDAELQKHPYFVPTLQRHGATMCLGLHGKMPAIDEQLPVLRKLWPTPLVCRWNLNHSFGPYGYPAAQEKHRPFDVIRTPDAATRARLARTIHGITRAGQAAFVTISNDAEGCAPRSIALLAETLRGL